MGARFVISSILLCLSCLGAAAQGGPSAWTDIMNRKKLVTCVVPAYPPYFWKDKEGQWQGFGIEIAKDVAKSLRVEPTYVETSFKTVILDIQSAKCDVFFGFNATPERALAIDFAGPLYTLGFLMVDRKGWSPPPGGRWADLNDPKIRICLAIGNSSEQQLRRFAPNSTRIALAQADECILALLSGRADTFVDGLMATLGAKQKNSELGAVRTLLPAYALPSYAGVRLDSDGRFQKFLQKWTEYNRANGNITEWITNSLSSVGITPEMIPPDVQF